ncbi:hypothetical protein ACWOAH_09645 [Vagococcus vulneris]|uniref:Gram-positive cocci surface proteins LPxTG domain-containing protein n=1 Tax=Vagococcus vulneris TaxID=1977869 RepID=A0A429ZU19_9ENTE|nr:hypothetical protein [Vagococcus vulneris]RST97155.1 hypothetical protein CBF37_10260 [Vagococcus vulneris]
MKKLFCLIYVFTLIVFGCSITVSASENGNQQPDYKSDVGIQFNKDHDKATVTGNSGKRPSNSKNTKVDNVLPVSVGTSAQQRLPQTSEVLQSFILLLLGCSLVVIVGSTIFIRGVVNYDLNK